MAIIIIEIVESEAEEIHELVMQKECGLITEDQFRDQLIRVLGEALPRGPERDDEIRLQVVKKVQVGYTGKGKRVVN